MNLEIGDILLTRNEGGDEVENPTPGYYNHAAIYIGDGKIIEAKAHVRDGKWSSNKEDPGAVILADEEEFFKRYPIIRILRNPKLDASLINNYAKNLVGMPYRSLASIFIIPRKAKKGVNCVSLVRKIVEKASGIDPRWRFPDDILKDVNWNQMVPY